MIRPLLFAWLFFSTIALAEPVALSGEDWARPRSGEALAQHPVLTRVMQKFERETDSVVVIAHATGEAGQLWAEELRSWLVALGIASARIHFEARPELQEALMLDVRPRSSL